MKVRKLFFESIHQFRFHKWLEFLNHKRKLVPVVVFHRIHPTYDRLTEPIHPDQFLEFLTALKKSYNFYPLSQFGVNDKNACYLTFDDATDDFYEYAFPILKSLNIPATLFVPVQSVDEGVRVWNNDIFCFTLFGNTSISFTANGEEKIISNGDSLFSVLEKISILNSSPEAHHSVIKEINDHLNDLDIPNFALPMSWKQLKEVKNSGVEIGNHGYSHKSFGQMTSEEIEQEISISQSRIKEELGVESVSFAFPMGIVKQSYLLDETFEHQCTTKSILSDSKNTMIPRISLYDKSAKEMIFRTAGFHSFITK